MRKKQAASGPPSSHAGIKNFLATQPLFLEARETHILDLGDDIFGKIYGCLEDFEDKKHLRSCCTSFYRSPAINSYIYLALYDMDDDDTPDDVVRFWADFPAHALMKTVQLTNADLKSITEGALGSADTSTVARKRCCNADEVVLENSEIPDAAVAGLLCLLFPKMRKSSGKAKLRLKGCSLPLSFLSILSVQTQLAALELVDCDLQLAFGSSVAYDSSESLMPLLGAFTSLSSLTLHFSGQKFEMDCTKLCVLQHLQILSLINVHLDHFDVLLPALASLHYLYLDRADLPSDIHLVSQSLRSLYVDTFSPTFPELSLSSLPALQKADFFTLDVGAGLSYLNGAQKVEKVAHMATWLSQVPVVAGNKVGCGVDDDEEEEEDDACDYWIRGKSNWSGDTCSSILYALSPLLEKLAAVPCSFKLSCWAFPGLTAMKSLCACLHDVKCLVLEYCKFGGDAHSGGFLEVLRRLPGLVTLCVKVDSPPMDALAVLAVANQMVNKRFKLILEPSNPSCYARLQETAEQWRILRDGLWPGLREKDSMVQLLVRQVG